MLPQLFYNAVFFHLDESNPTSEAIVVENEIITDCGNYQEMILNFPNALQTDLQGAFVFPGFNDAHAHLWKMGSLLTHIIDLRGLDSIQKVLEALKSSEKDRPEDGWILARGFNEVLWEFPTLPTRSDLDVLFPNRPCQLMRTCAHIAVVNSYALALAGVNEHTPDPVGGKLGRFENGSLDGVLFESAMKLVNPYIPEVNEDQVKKMILDAQEKCLEMGITSMTDPEIYPLQLSAYEQLEQEGLLKLRINLFPVHLPDREPLIPMVSEGTCDRKLQIDTVKFFADGGLSGQTAALFRPYLASDNYGILRMKPDYFFKLAERAQVKGWKIATHAIGDAAIDQVISVYKALKNKENNHLIHRIEHLGLPHDRHLNDMRDVGITAVSQPAFVRELGPNFKQYLDEEYQEDVYPYKKILDRKVALAFSSDAPVVKDFRPLRGIRDALERMDIQGNEHNPKERISMMDAFLAYTLGGAKADGLAHIKGKLAPGFLADFVVLDKNPFSTALEDWEDIRVLHVYLGGALVFSKSNGIL
jgi:predicted amidohydrolase YtcJ